MSNTVYPTHPLAAELIMSYKGQIEYLLNDCFVPVSILIEEHSEELAEIVDLCAEVNIMDEVCEALMRQVPESYPAILRESNELRNAAIRELFGVDEDYDPIGDLNGYHW